jgi:hypothetical protein
MHSRLRASDLVGAPMQVPYLLEQRLEHLVIDRHRTANTTDEPPNEPLANASARAVSRLAISTEPAPRRRSVPTPGRPRVDAEPGATIREPTRPPGSSESLALRLAKRPHETTIGLITTRRILYGLAAMVALLVVGTTIGLIWADTSNVAGAFAGATNVISVVGILVLVVALAVRRRRRLS